MRTFLFILFLAAICIHAIHRGGGPERWTAYIVIGMVTLDPLVHLVTPLDYTDLDPGHLIIDVAAWGGLLVIALRSNRFWPLCVASFQTVALVAHIAKIIDVTIHPKAYMIMQVASSYPLLVTLLIGTYCHQRRLRSKGSDLSWRH